MVASISRQDIARQIANVVCIPLGIAANYLPARSTRIAEISRANEPLLAAASWTFAIWAFIFAGQCAYAVFQALPSQRERPLHRRIGWFTALNGALGGLWTIAFTHQAFIASWLLIVAMLVTLVAIDVQLENEAHFGAELLCARFPFGVNLGWIQVAAILSTAQVLYTLVHFDGGPLSPVVWATTLIIGAGAIAAFMVFVRHNDAAGIAIAWGLTGIAAYRADVGPIAFVAATCASLTLGAVCFELVTQDWRPVRRIGSRHVGGRPAASGPASASQRATLPH